MSINAMTRFFPFWLVIFSLIACSTKTDGPIKIAVSTTPLSAPFYVAEEKGYFKNFCGRVELLDIAGGRQSFITMANKEADFATASESVMVFQSVERADFVNISTFVESVDDIKILTRKSNGINSPLDLINKTIGYIKGSSSEYLLSIVLALYDIPADKINLVDLAPEETPKALIEGHVDAISTWEPFTFQVRENLGDDVIILNTKHLYSLTFNLISPRELVNSNPQKARCVLEALAMAIDDINADPDYAMNLVKRKLDLDDTFIRWIWPDYLFKLSLKRTLILTMQAQTEWLLSKEKKDNKPIIEAIGLIAPEPLKSIEPLAVRL